MMQKIPKKGFFKIQLYRRLKGTKMEKIDEGSV